MKAGFVKTDTFSRVMRGSAKCLAWMNCRFDGVGKVDAGRILMGRFLIRTCIVIPDVFASMRHVDGMNGIKTLGLQDMPCMRSSAFHLGGDRQVNLT